MNQLLYKCSIWRQVEPGIWANEDGRLQVEHDGQTLILPAPAAEIWELVYVRRLLRNQPQHQT